MEEKIIDVSNEPMIKELKELQRQKFDIQMRCGELDFEKDELLRQKHIVNEQMKEKQNKIQRRYGLKNRKCAINLEKLVVEVLD